MPEWLGAAIAFVYGTVVGSFLNVCVYRLPAEQSIVSPPSHCPKCSTRLKAADLVPLFSFLLLGRKCRYCGAPISWRYFLVELATGLLFGATYLRFGLSIDFFAYAAFISALIVAFAVDLDLFLIPDQVSIVGVVIGLGRDLAHWLAGDVQVLRIPIPFTDHTFPMIPSVAGIVVCGGIFYLIAYVSYYVFRPKDEKEMETYEGAMGGGDVKLAAAIGAVLGIVPALASFLIAVLLGTLFGVALVIVKSAKQRKGMPWRTEIPFGPYLVVGAVAVILAQPQLRLLWAAWINFITPG
jgi:prepilin signal peptidase PulO-like enzyme (type II secretory pathway)